MKSVEDSRMQGIREELVRIFANAIETAFPDVPCDAVPVVPSSKFGDYQCNAAMQLSQLLKAQGTTLHCINQKECACIY